MKIYLSLTTLQLNFFLLLLVDTVGGTNRDLIISYVDFSRESVFDRHVRRKVLLNRVSMMEFSLNLLRAELMEFFHFF